MSTNNSSAKYEFCIFPKLALDNTRISLYNDIHSQITNSPPGHKPEAEFGTSKTKSTASRGTDMTDISSRRPARKGRKEAIMAFSASPRGLSAAPRYSVTRRLVQGAEYAAPSIEGTQYTEYCETFADVKARLQHHAGGMAKASTFVWVREPEQWFADAVQNVCRNQRRAYAVAKVTNGVVTEWLSVVAL